MMARSEAQKDRQQYRKTQAMIEQTHGGYAGRSIIQILTDQLDNAMHRYMDAKEQNNQALARTCRGEVRGLARAISTMTNPYQPTRAIKRLETESASRVRKERHVKPVE